MKLKYKPEIVYSMDQDTSHILKFYLENGIEFITQEVEGVKEKSDLKTISKTEALEALKDSLTNFEGSNLKLTAKNMVFSDGNPDSKIMLLGEAPGAEEDEQGLPFVGQSGKLLDKVIASIGLNRNNVYITNIVNWRPPANRTPTSDEIALFQPFVERHVEIIEPKIIVLLGGVASKAILNSTDGILKLRGKWFDYKKSENIMVLPTLHPAYLLRSPRQKELIWQDMLTLRKKIIELNIKI